MSELVAKGKDPNILSYEQMDTFGSWRDMRNTGLRNQFMLKNKDAEQKDLPKNLRGKQRQNIAQKTTQIGSLVRIKPTSKWCT